MNILKKAFDVYDKDGSGTIDHEELRKLFQDLRWPVHDEFLQRAVRVLDEDMSGGIDFSELLNWTEFAYASRILYRSEMMPTTPRRALFMDSFLDSDDEEALPVTRFMSLGTVHEHKETGSHHDDSEDEEEDRTGMVEAATEMATRRDELDAERAGGSDSLLHLSDALLAKKVSICDPQSNRNVKVMCGSSSEAKGVGRLLRTEMSGTARKQRGNAAKVSFQCEQGPFGALTESRDSGCHEEEIPLRVGLETNVETYNSRHEGAASETQQTESVIPKVTDISLTEGNNLKSVDVSEGLDSKSDGANGFTDFGMPIKRMATMLLGTPKPGRLLSSRPRSQSMSAMSRASGGLGYRTESKMTVRMRWACGQLQDDGEDEDDSGSGSGSDEVQTELKDRPKKATDRTLGWERQDEREGVEPGTMKRRRSHIGMARMASEDLRGVDSQ